MNETKVKMQTLLFFFLTNHYGLNFQILNKNYEVLFLVKYLLQYGAETSLFSEKNAFIFYKVFTGLNGKNAS